ncbi:hypothetical protein [Cellulomonas sp. KRMCY2]|uniref:hypothetical protein n=1 Tax=Cellulomonas sp. KRMCY2 TaxID=1304865 RepID=UPI00045EA058|nr:hypothetical protein [Cellulomonas sp. KRMCY2]
MNHNESFTAALRTMADQTPLIRVDRHTVLRLGRRRRAARTAGVSVMIAVGVAGLYGGVVAALPRVQDHMVAPATPTPEPSPERSVTAVGAVVDKEAGTISLPLDERIWSSADVATMQAAVDLYVSRCMADAGLGAEYTFQGPYAVQPDDVYYGVWVRAVVLESGYRSLGPDTSRPGSGLRGNDPRISTQTECYLSALKSGLTYEPTDFDATAPVGHKLPADLPEGQVVMDEWRQCLRANDVAPPVDDASLLPRDALGAPLEEQIRIGLIDVDCKEQTDFVQRIADIDAAEQLAYIERASDYLQQIRPIQQSVITKARAYLQDAGVPIPGD